VIVTILGISGSPRKQTAGYVLSNNLENFKLKGLKQISST
jgi:hypothetical protein